MKFAVADGKRIEATKGVKGYCPSCSSELIAKCGEVKINHWAHKGIRNCDPWWEPETEWHRSWKNNFPPEWQEFPLLNERTGEKHIADIRTRDGLVIEFQHSHIDPQERTSRENFYKNLVWVIDGTRLKNDYKRFLKAKEYFDKTSNKEMYFVSPEDCFPSAWIGSPVPIILDFRGTGAINDSKDIRNNLYCLFPKLIPSGSLLLGMSHESFTRDARNGEWSRLVNNMIQFQKSWQSQMDRLNRQQNDQSLATFARYSLHPSLRRGFRRF